MADQYSDTGAGQRASQIEDLPLGQYKVTLLDLARSPNGVPSDSVHHDEIESHQLRRDVVRGKDINLAALFIQGFNPDGDSSRQLFVGSETIPLKPLSHSSRILRSLTIQEFILAFEIF